MPSQPLLKVHKHSSTSGLSLIELAMAMMIMVILSVGVSSLLQTGIESQLSERAHQEMQSVAMNIVDDLRNDIRTANKAAVSNGNNTLTLTMPTGNITYSLAADGKFSRVSSVTGTKQYLSGQMTNMKVACPSGCFRAELLNSDNTPSPRQISVPEISVQQVINGNRKTIIDTAFNSASFSLRNFSFDVLSATEFK